MNFAEIGKTIIGDYMKKAIRIFDIVLFAICVIIFGVVIWGNIALPDNIITYDNEQIPFSKVVTYSSNSKSNSIYVDSQNSPNRRTNLKLFGVIPIKEVTVSNQQSRDVYISGEVFGIKLYTDGVIVVGTQSVETDNGKVNPAQDSGIEVGDVIISINGIKVFTSDAVQSMLNDNNGSSFNITVKRADRYREYELTPVFCPRENCYKAGMWVRDSTAGIGTLTFYDSQSGLFGALGHQVNDVDTNEIMPLLEGEAVSATVTDIQKAGKGTTGSIECEFSQNTIGRLTDNTECGIFGHYSYVSENAKSYPVASVQEVKKGKATLVSTVSDSVCEEYEIEITHINYNENNRQKNMIVKVTDERLLGITGGIVQGMSGSPIIQDGKLVGALTHVIVNNPEKGYAVFAQTMLDECD